MKKIVFLCDDLRRLDARALGPAEAPAQRIDQGDDPARNAGSPAGPPGSGVPTGDTAALERALSPAFTLADTAELAQAAGIDVIHNVALLLKCAWEDHIAEQIPPGAQAGPLRLYVEEHLLELRDGFSPNPNTLFNIMEEHGRLASGAGYDERGLATLCQEMILADLHLVANNSPELQAFSERELAAHACLRDSTLEQGQSYTMTKSSWLQRQDEFGEALLVLEQRRLENANIEHRWLVTFGKEFLQLEEQSRRLERARLRLRILEADPDLTAEALDALVTEAEAQMEKEIESLRWQAALAPYLGKPSGGEPVNAESLAEYRKELKHVLRQLWMLIHPDKLRNHPQYAQLTEQQRQQIEALWHRCMKIRSEEMGFEAYQLGSRYRSLPVLWNALETARAILAAAGIDTDVSLIIQGETLVEQLSWLEAAIGRLDREIGAIQAELKLLLDDPETRERSAMLTLPSDRQEELRAEMRARAEAYRTESEELEAQLQAHLSGGGVS